MSEDDTMAHRESADSGHAPNKKRAIRRFLEHSAGTARQLMQPSAFRISEPQNTEEPLAPQPNGAGRPAERTNESSSTDEHLATAMRTLAAVATAVWRAKSKLNAESQIGLPPELRHLPRHIQAAWDALAAGHIQVHDPTGQRYVPGMAVNALAFQPLEGIGTEVIHETIKPSVYFGDLLIQRADVIVGRPPVESDGEGKVCAPPADAKQNGSNSLEQKGPKEHGPNDD